LQQLVKDFPSITDYHADLAMCLLKLGMHAKAEDEFRSVLQDQQRLADQHRNDPEYRLQMAITQSYLASALHRQGQHAEAVAQLRDGLEEQQRLADEHPNIGYRHEVAATHEMLAVWLRDMGNPEAAQLESQAALAVLQRLADEHPTVADFRMRLALQQRNLGRKAVAAAEWHTAYKEYQRLAAEHPNFPRHRRDLAQISFPFAALLCELGKWDDAEKVYCTLLKEYQRLAEEHPDVPGYRQNILVRIAEQFLTLKDKLPKMLNGQVQPAAADEQLAMARMCQCCLNQCAAATRYYAQAFAARPALATLVRGQPMDRFNAACAAAMAGCGRGEDAASLDDQERTRLRQQARTWLRLVGTPGQASR
jgi:tetratricopeptide (TPR) repeat protein